MSESLSSSSPSMTSTPETPDTAAEVTDSPDAILDSSTEHIDDAAPSSEHLDDTVDSTLEHTPEEELVKGRLDRLEELRIGTREKFISPRLDEIDSILDWANNKTDATKRKVFMLDRREAAAQNKAIRLEAKMTTIRPDTMRHRRLKLKLRQQNSKLGSLSERIHGIDIGSGRRSRTSETLKEGRSKEIELRKELLKVDMRIATEKKRRRDKKNELKNATNEITRDRLKAELIFSESKPLSKLRQELTKEVYKKVMDKKDSK